MRLGDSDEANLEPSFGRERFLEWRAPRYGDANPERMDNPVWEWLVRTGLDGYRANERFNGPSSTEAGPCWSFDRFGRSETLLPDDRRVLIAGEHEDWYDDDFFIYNDVVVIDPQGAIAIHGYPPDCFPPTDFHTATLVGLEIVVIGNLGYDEARGERTSDVFVLDTDSFAFRRVGTTGEQPGWLHGHEAWLSDDGTRILVRGGKLDRGAGRSLIENIDDWELDLRTWAWACVERRDWQRREITRADKARSRLWEIRRALWNLEVGWETDYRKSMTRLREDLGREPDVPSVKALYKPDVPHEPLPEVEDEYRIHRIEVDGVTVRYVEDDYSIQMTVEGELPDLTVRLLGEDVRRKLSELENAECCLENIP